MMIGLYCKSQKKWAPMNGTVPSYFVLKVIIFE